MVWAISYDFSAFLLCRIVGGFSKGNVGIVIASVTDITSRESRTKGMVSFIINFYYMFVLANNYMYNGFCSKPSLAQDIHFYKHCIGHTHITSSSSTGRLKLWIQLAPAGALMSFGNNEVGVFC